MDNVNLKDIAEICGVSVATVSRVINQNGRYSKKTGEKVRKVIEEYEYQPNQIAKGLRTSKVDAIGVIVPDITNEFFSAVVLALQKRLFRAGYSCMIFNTDESAQIERCCVANLKSLGISGIVSFNSRLNLRKMINESIPIVYVDRKPEQAFDSENAAFISSDHEDGAYQAGHELAACGCRRVACITALSGATVTRMRSDGFIRACKDYHMELPPELVFVPKEVSLQSGYDIMDRALKDGLRFDGVFCQTDWLAIGALSAILDHGIDVPGEIQLIGFDDITSARIARRPLTTVHQPSAEIGLHSAELILAMVNGRKVGKDEVKFPVELVRRGTTHQV